MRLLILPCLILPGIAACAAPSGPSSSGPRMPVDLASALDSISADDLLRHTKTLASDEYEGRGPGTKGEELTVKYLTEQFKRLGLAPATPTARIVQKVPLAGFTAEPHCSIVAGGRRTDAGSFPTTTSRFRAGSCRTSRSRTPTSSSSAMAWSRPEYGWDDYKGVDVRGKTIVMLINDPRGARRGRSGEARREDVQGQGHDLLRPLDLQVRDRSREGRRGRDHRPRDRARPVIPTKSFSGKLGTRELRHRRRPTRTWGASPSSRGSRLDRAKELFTAAGQDFDALKKAAAIERLQARAARCEGELRRQEHAARGRVAQRRRQARGLRPRLEERIRHLHGALGSPGPRSIRSQGDQIFNGALDNASGTARCSSLPKRSRSSRNDRRSDRSCSSP